MKRAYEKVIIPLALDLLVMVLVVFSFQQEIQVLQNEVNLLKQEQQALKDSVTRFLAEWQIDTFDSSAYSPLDDKNGLNSWGDGTVMNSGVSTAENIDTAIAVDKSVIPLGSRVWIQGIGWRIALDTGGTIKDKKLDICMANYADAISYGRKEVIVVWPKQL